MNNEARLYFELHITVNPHRMLSFNDFTRDVGETWKTSVFDIDFVDEENGKWFASARCQRRAEIQPKVLAIMQRLEKLGYEVTRAKAEDTLIDTKYGDDFSHPVWR